MYAEAAAWCFSFLKFLLFAWAGGKRGGESVNARRKTFLLWSQARPVPPAGNRIKSATAILKFCFGRETCQQCFSRQVSRNNMKEIRGTKKLRGNEREKRRPPFQWRGFETKRDRTEGWSVPRSRDDRGKIARKPRDNWNCTGELRASRCNQLKYEREREKLFNINFWITLQRWGPALYPLSLSLEPEGFGWFIHSLKIHKLYANYAAIEYACILITYSSVLTEVN